MNWFIREKMFTYCYNKFWPVNRVHYIKCGVNISLLTYFWLLHLGSLFYHHTQYSQWGWFTNSLLCDIPQNKAPHTGPHHIWRIYTLCPFSGHEKNTDGSGVGLTISLASTCYGDSWVTKHFFAPELGLPVNLGMGRSWLFPDSSFKFFTRRSLKSQWVYLTPHEDNSIRLLSTVRFRKWKNNFVVRLKVRQIAVSHTIRIVDVTHVPVVPFHIVRFQGAFPVVTKISFCWWWVHVSQHVNFSSVLPN